MRAGPDAGRADVAALAGSLVLAAAALVPALRLRSHPARTGAAESIPAAGPAVPSGAGERERFGSALVRAEAFRPVLAASGFRPEPSRALRPPVAAPAPDAARVADLDGRVEEGRLVLRWRPAPGSRGTRFRLEGLGGGDAVDCETAGDEGLLRLPVPGAQGTVVARATPLGVAVAAAEARVSIPYRVPCEVVRAERADPGAGLALVVLRRAYDGRAVEASFAVHANDDLGGLASVGEGGAVVEFRTGFVVEEIRRRREEAPPPPEFLRDGRVRRDGSGRPVRRPAAGQGPAAGAVVVLRGVDDERRVLEVR